MRTLTQRLFAKYLNNMNITDEIQKHIDTYPNDNTIYEKEQTIAKALSEIRRCPREDAIQMIAALKLIAIHWEDDLKDDAWELD